MIAVLAGTYHQFKNWCESNGHNPMTGRTARLIASRYDLQGMVFDDYVKIGTWQTLPPSLIDLFDEKSQRQYRLTRSQELQTDTQNNS
jgi:hypothetical protein